MTKFTKAQYERKILKGKKLSDYTWEFVRASEELGLKYKFITHPSVTIERHMEIYYKKKMMRIMPASTPFNNIVAHDVSVMKHLSNQILRDAGLPVPLQYVVKSSDDKQLQKMSFPLVVKPLHLSGGKGISADVSTPAELKKAIKIAQKVTNEYSIGSIKKKKVLVEEMIKGNENRLLVFKGKLIAAVQRIPASLVADGKHTVAELIEINNNRQGVNRRVYDIVVDYDLHHCLKRQKLKMESVPPKDTIVQLHTVSNASKGATIKNVTDDVHPKFKKIAIAAAKTIDLVLGGIDVMAEDITKSPTGQEHGIIEVNSRAGVRMHCNPNVGQMVDVPKILIKDYLGIK